MYSLWLCAETYQIYYWKVQTPKEAQKWCKILDKLWKLESAYQLIQSTVFWHTYSNYHMTFTIVAAVDISMIHWFLLMHKVHWAVSGYLKSAIFYK